jgi:Invasion associated locus B (IalB) protein
MIRKFLLGSLCAVSLTTPAFADAANLLGVFGNWSAYSTGSGNAMTCYAMSQPRASQPKKLKRAATYLMVSDWPGRKVKAEPEVAPGYAYKLGAPVALEIGNDKFNFFARNDGQNGTAWLQNLKDGDALMDALNHGVSAVALGTSARGTKTMDTYSLAGFTDAVAKIHAACNMG